MSRFPESDLRWMRQALALAINRTDLVNTALQGYGTPGDSPKMASPIHRDSQSSLIPPP